MSAATLEAPVEEPIVREFDDVTGEFDDTPDAEAETETQSAEPPSEPPSDTTTAATPDGDGHHSDPLPVLTPSKATHLSPEALALYDAETVRLITEQEQIVAEKLLHHKDLQKRAKDAKDI